MLASAFKALVYAIVNRKITEVGGRNAESSQIDCTPGLILMLVNYLNKKKSKASQLMSDLLFCVHVSNMTLFSSDRHIRALGLSCGNTGKC